MYDMYEYGMSSSERLIRLIIVTVAKIKVSCISCYYPDPSPKQGGCSLKYTAKYAKYTKYALYAQHSATSYNSCACVACATI